MTRRIPGRRNPSHCPNCGERVSPYAAGCAVCGADLDHTRFDRPDPIERLRRMLPVSYGIPLWLIAMIAIVVGFLVVSYLA